MGDGVAISIDGIEWKSRNGNFYYVADKDYVKEHFARRSGAPIVVTPSKKVRAWQIKQTNFVLNGVDVLFVERGGKRPGYETAEPLTDDAFAQLVTSNLQANTTTVREAAPPPVYVSDEELDVATPMELAWRRYSELRAMRTGEGLTVEENQEYYRLYLNRRYTSNWRGYGHDLLAERFPVSLQDTEVWVEKWDDFVDWFEGCVPTEELFMQRYNIDDVDSLGRKDTDGGGYYTWKWRDRFDSELRTWRGFFRAMRSTVDDVREQCDLLDGISDPIEAVKMEIAMVGQDGLGLTLHPSWNTRDDGCVWFVDESTGINYFYTLFWLIGYNYTYHVSGGVEVKYKSETSTFDWREHPGVALNNTALVTTSSRLSDNIAPIRRIRDYFGAFDRIEYYVKQHINNVPVPHGIQIPF